MIGAMITLGHALGVQALTEGVETNDQLGRLDTLQCDLAQGYLFTRPLPAEAVGDYLALHSQEPAPELSGADEPSGRVKAKAIKIRDVKSRHT